MPFLEGMPSEKYVKVKSQGELTIMFNEVNRKLFNRIDTVQARLATVNEVVQATLSGELIRIVAKLGDVVVKNVAGELAVMTKATFNTLYRADLVGGVLGGIVSLLLNSKWQTFIAIGTCYALQYEGKSIQFKTTVGVQATLNPGDWLVCPNQRANNDLVKIENSVFILKYK